MTQAIKIKIKPGGAIQFPAICVHCSNRAAEGLRLHKRSGQITRMVDVPLCQDCYHQTQRQSAKEEQLRKLSRLVSPAIALLVLIVLLLMPSGMPYLLRIPASIVGALIAGIGLHLWFDRRSQKAALPEKKEILSSASIADFSWRATTFEFANETFCDRFIELNRAKLM